MFFRYTNFFLPLFVARRATNGKRSFPNEARSAEKKKSLFSYCVTIFVAPTVSRFAAKPQRDTRWALPSRKQNYHDRTTKDTVKKIRCRRQVPQCRLNILMFEKASFGSSAPSARRSCSCQETQSL